MRLNELLEVINIKSHVKVTVEPNRVVLQGKVADVQEQAEHTAFGNSEVAVVEPEGSDLVIGIYFKD